MVGITSDTVNVRARIETDSGDLANLSVASPETDTDAATKQYVDEHVPEDVVTNEVLEQKLQEVVGTPGFTCQVTEITKSSANSDTSQYNTHEEGKELSEWYEFVDESKIPEYNPITDLVFLRIKLMADGALYTQGGWHFNFAINDGSTPELLELSNFLYSYSSSYDIDGRLPDQQAQIIIPLVLDGGALSTTRKTLKSVRGVLYTPEGSSNIPIQMQLIVYTPGKISSNAAENESLREEMEKLKKEMTDLKQQFTVLNESLTSLIESATQSIETRVDSLEHAGYQTAEQVEAAINNKGYITRQTADDTYVNITGDTMTGALNLPEPVDDANGATKQYLDEAEARVKALI